MTDSDAGGSRTSPRRDAARTRGDLLDAARRLFAQQGYAATSVRQVAGSAGVNASLISRYFESKEKLFEAAVAAAVDDLTSVASGAPHLDDIARAIAVMALRDTSDSPPELLLLLRSSGDPRSDAVRVGVLHTFAEQLSELGTPGAANLNAGSVLLRAQLVVALSLGIALVRSWDTPLPPLATATLDDLEEPLRAVLHSLMGTPADGDAVL